MDFGTDLTGGFVYRFPPLKKGQQITFHFADAKKNAKVICGGGAMGDTGWFIEPTLVQTDDPAYRLGLKLGVLPALRSLRLASKALISGA